MFVNILLCFHEFEFKRISFGQGLKLLAGDSMDIVFVVTGEQERKESPKYAKGSIEAYENARKHLRVTLGLPVLES